MSTTGSTCAMCGDRLAEPHGGYQLPAPCVQLLDGGDDVDPSTIAGEVAEKLGVSRPVVHRVINNVDANIIYHDRVKAREQGGKS